MPFAPVNRSLLFLLSLLAMLLAPGDRGMAASAGSSADALFSWGTDMLDRVVYAVDGAELGHGTDSRMWRAELNGPQGPMQVSAAAAVDAGGGDRFDEGQNRALGRAYLARMYRRYNSWSDAIAAYNWGPGNMDGWIGGGRAIERFPPAVAQYRARVLVASGLSLGSAKFAVGRAGFRLIRRGIVHMQPRRPVADRRRGNGPDEVELLYTKIMRATDPNSR